MKVKELLSVLNSADSEADVFVSVLLGDSEIDLEVEAVTDLDYAVFVEPERLYITHGHKTDRYIPKKSPNFTFHIFDPDSGETIARDIPLSDEKAKEIFDSCEKIKAEKPDDRLNRLHEDEEESWEKSDYDKVTPGPIYVPFSKLKEYMVDDGEKENGNI